MEKKYIQSVDGLNESKVEQSLLRNLYDFYIEKFPKNHDDAVIKFIVVIRKMITGKDISKEAFKEFIDNIEDKEIQSEIKRIVAFTDTIDVTKDKPKPTTGDCGNSAGASISAC